MKHLKVKEKLHNRVKIAAIKSGVFLQDFVEQLLDDGLKNNSKTKNK